MQLITTLIVYVLHCGTFKPLFKTGTLAKTPSCKAAAQRETHLNLGASQYNQSHTVMQLQVPQASVNHLFNIP